MLRRFAVSALLVLAIVGLPGARITLADEPDVRIENDLIFAKREGAELGIDIAYPTPGDAPRPTLVFIHGGGWRGGDRTAYRGLLPEFARHGYVAISASYRLSQVAAWPAQLDDVEDAVRWLRANAAKYGADPERIGAIGHSAGGHLSLMLGLRSDGVAHADARVHAVANYFGPTDLTIEEFRPDVAPLIDYLVGGDRAQRQDIVRDASPVTWIDRSDAPILTFHGTVDQIVPVNQAHVLHRALAAGGVPNELVLLEGKDHGWGGEDVVRTTAKTFEFFDRHLAGSTMPLVAFEDFDGGADHWEPTDPTSWTLAARDGRTFYSLTKSESAYEPPVRSPFNVALLRGLEVSDMVLDVDLRSTHEPYGHQDLCLVFGYQDPAHFYYVHIGRAADAHAHSIFIVDGEPRRSIATERTEGFDWTRGWHRARIVRSAGTGRIEVYVDDLDTPIMTTTDRRFLHGRVGIGSFDDTGDFDAVRLRGRVVARS